MVCSYKIKLKDGRELFFKTDEDFAEYLANEGTFLVEEYQASLISKEGLQKEDKSKTLDALSRLDKSIKPQDKQKFDDDYELLRKITEEKYEKIQSEEIEWFKRVFKDYDVILKIVSSIINGNAWGKFTTSGTLLYHAAASGTAYHEAWHNFSQLFLTKAEKIALYKEVRENEPSLKNATDKEIEEWLADRFMEYAKSNGTAPAPTFRKSIFRKIWDFIREFFGYRNLSPDKLFKDLYRGNLENYDFSKSNSIWGNLNSTIKNNGKEIFSVEESHLLFNYFDALFGEKLRKDKLLYRYFIEGDPEKIKTLFSDLRNFIYDEIFGVKDEQGNTIKEGLLQYIIPLYKANPEHVYSKTANIILKISESNNFDVLFKHWLKTINRNEYLEDIFEEDHEDTYAKENEDDESFSEFDEEEQELISAKLGEFKQKSLIETLSKETKNIIRTLPRVEVNSDTGLPIKDENGEYVLKRNEIGLYEPVNFTYFVNKLGFILADSLDIEEMIEKMQDPENIKLLPEIPLLLERLGINDRNNLDKVSILSSFEKDFKRTYVGVYDLEIVEEEIDENDLQAEPTKVYSYFKEETKQGLRFLKTKFRDNFLFLPESEYIGKKEDGSKYIKKDLIKLIDSYISFSGNVSEKTQKFVEIMQYLGIKFTEQTISSGDIGRYIMKNQKEVNRSLSEIKSRLNFNEEITDPIKNLSERSPNTKVSIYYFLNDILKIEEKYNPDTTSLVYKTAKGTKKYALMNFSFMFTVMNRLKNAKTLSNFLSRKEFEIFDDPNSLIINSLFDRNEQGFRRVIADVNYGKKTNELIWGDYNGFISSFNIDFFNKQTTDLTLREKIIMDLNALLSHGAIDIMRTEASSSSYFYKLDAYIHSYTDSKGVKRDITVTRLPFNLTLLFDKSKVVLKSELIKDYFYRIYQEENETGHGFFAEIIPNGNKNLSKEEVYSLVRTFLLKETESLLKFFASHGIDKDTIRKYLNTDLINEFEQLGIKDENLLQSVVSAFLINDIVLNYEYGKLIARHPKYYKAYHKRAKTAISTGIPLSTSQYNKEYLESTFNRTMEYGLTNTEREYDLFTYTAKVVDDPVGSVKEIDLQKWSMYVKNPEKLEAYKNFNPADGQGRITFDAYREFRIRTGSWGHLEEINYVREVYKWKVRKGIKPSEIETIIVNKFKDEPYVRFSVIKGQYSGIDEKGRPIVHKFSLAPMIPSVIEGTPLDEFNDYLLKNNINYFTHASGNKVFAESISSLLTKNEVKFEMSEKGNQKLFSIFLKEQQPTKSKGKSLSNWGTQLRKLFMSNLFSKGVSSKKFEELKEEYLNTMDYIRKVQEQKLFERFGIKKVGENYVIENVKPFVDTLLEQFDLRNLNTNLKESIKYDEKTKSFQYPLEINLQYQDISNIISGLVDRIMRRIEVPGDQLVMVSPVGLENPNKPLKFYEVIEKDGKFVKTSKIEVMIGFSEEYKPLLKLIHPDGNPIQTVDRLNEAIDNDAWREKHEKELTHIGYRIPTQGPNSIDVAIVRKFLPETFYGIVVPQAYVVKTGADYDIDKIFWMRPSYNKSGKRVEFDLSEKELLDIISENSDLNLIREFMKLKFTDLENFTELQVSKFEKVEELISLEELTKEYYNFQNFKKKLFEKTYKEGKDELVKEINSLMLIEDYIKEEIERYKKLKSSILPQYQEVLENLYNNKNEIVEEIKNKRIELYNKLRKTYNYKLEEFLKFKFPEKYEKQINALYQLKNPLNAAFNKIIDIYETVMTSPEMFEQLITPNSSARVRDVAVKMMKLLGYSPSMIEMIEKNTGFKNTSIYKPIVNYIKFYENLEGRKDLGMWAITSTMSQLLEQENIEINPKYEDTFIVYTKMGIKEVTKTFNYNQLLLPPDKKEYLLNLSHVNDVSGRIKQEIISELINATVDIASDPFYSYLGINRHNKSIVSFLLLQNVPFETVILFINQPILRELYRMVETEPFVMSNIGLMPSLRYHAIVLLSKRGSVIFGRKDLKITSEYITNLEFREILNKVTTDYRNVFFSEGKPINTILQKEIIENPFGKSDIQKIVLAHFMELRYQSSYFKSFQFSNNFDTTKFNSPYSAIRNKEGLREVLSKKIFRNIEKISQRSLISIFDNRDLLAKIYETLFPVLYDKTVFTYLLFGLKPDIYSKKEYEKYEKRLLSNFIEFIVKRYGFTETGENIGYYGLSLVTKGIKKDELFYERLEKLSRKHPELQNIELFRRLTVNFEKGGLKRANIELNRGLENTTYIQNLLHSEFYKLIYSDPREVLQKDMSNEDILEIKNFFKDLAYVGFYQSGFSKSKLFFGDIIPNELFRDRFLEAIEYFKNHVIPDKELLSKEMSVFLSNFKTFEGEFFGVYTSVSYRGKNYGDNSISSALKISFTESKPESFKEEKEIKSIQPKLLLDIPSFQHTGILILDKKTVDLYKELSKGTLIPEFFAENINYIPSLNASYKPTHSQKFVLNKFGFYDFIDISSGETLIENVDLNTGMLMKHEKEGISIAGSKVKKVPHFYKDQIMAMSSTKAIAAPLSPKTTNYQSSSVAYVETLRNKNILNRGFVPEDKVWIFGNLNNYGGITEKENRENFEKRYIPVIDQAIEAGVRIFNVGLASGIDEMASEYLKSKGFKNIPKGGWNQWVLETEEQNAFELSEQESEKIYEELPNKTQSGNVIVYPEGFTGIRKLGDKAIVETIENKTNQNLSSKQKPLEVFVDGSDIKGTGAIGFGVYTEYNNNEYKISGAFDTNDLQKLEKDLNVKIEGAVSNYAMEMYGSLVAIRNTPKEEYIHIKQDLEGVQLQILSELLQRLGNVSFPSNKSGKEQYAKWWQSLSEEKRKELFEKANEIVELDKTLLEKSRNINWEDRPGNKFTNYTRGQFAQENYTKAIASKIVDLLLERPGKVKYTWVKGHSGIEGNEKVDTIAKDRNVYNTYKDLFTEQNENIESEVQIISTRIPNTNEHFGNPFSHEPEGKTPGLIKTKTIQEAVENYIDWIINGTKNFIGKLSTQELAFLEKNESRRQWIREQLKSGKLKNKPILYYKELGEPSHANALDYLINKYDWSKDINNQNNLEKQGLIYNDYLNLAEKLNKKVKITKEEFDKLSEIEKQHLFDQLKNC